MFLTRQKQTYTNNVLEGISHDFLLPQKVGGEDLSEDFRIYNELSKTTRRTELVGYSMTQGNDNETNSPPSPPARLLPPVPPLPFSLDHRSRAKLTSYSDLKLHAFPNSFLA